MARRIIYVQDRSKKIYISVFIDSLLFGDSLTYKILILIGELIF